MKIVTVFVAILVVAVLGSLRESPCAVMRYHREQAVRADRKWLDGSGTYYIYLQGRLLYIPQGPYKGYWHPAKDDPNRWFGDKGSIVLKDGQLHMPGSEIYFPTN